MEMTTGKIILTLSEIWAVPARHGNVPCAYIKASTEPYADIYLYALQGMKVSEKELQHCVAQHTKQVMLWLQHSLYGFKKAEIICAQLPHSELLPVGFVQFVTDSCLYYKRDQNGNTIVGIYVHAFLVTGTSKIRVDDVFIKWVTLMIKDLGIVSKFLGM